MTEQFTWIAIYQEIADTLLEWQEKQSALISFLEDLRKQGYVITPLEDKDKNGERSLLTEIDPFTFMGVFNRGIRADQRVAILAQFKKFFGLKSDLPVDFDGIPVLNNMKSRFFPHQDIREPNHISLLWRVFQLALQEDPLQDKTFWEAFDNALALRLVNVTLTMGLFWIRPNVFLSLDKVNRKYLGIDLPKLDANFYLEVLQKVKSGGRSFPEISLAAWKKSQESDSGVEDAPQNDILTRHNYWLVGAYWDSYEPADQTQRFIEEGVWINGYEDRLLDEVKSMRVGDKIAIKASSVQRRGLPFNAQGRAVSRMIIKAVGTIVKNRGDGRMVEVEWDADFKEKSWYFYTHRGTLWKLRTEDGYWGRDYSKKLVEFIWYGKPQDYDWFCKRWWSNTQELPPPEEKEEAVTPSKKVFGIDNVIAAGVFLEEREISDIIERWRSKKAIILQGAPGVGKTFLVNLLAFALMEEEDRERVEFVQFHQSYSYDDFVRGYRPAEAQTGAFELHDGIFYAFCQKAASDPERPYVFIIDEINRGNLSQIFGELLMLIESDKRKSEYAIPLVYRRQGEERFYIPPNLYLVGLMNLADRSLAIVDYALRRRFSFINLKPKYDSALYRKWLLEREMDENLANLIISRMSDLNRTISEDPLLGENYQIGHSYFCPKGGDNFSRLDRDWYESIVRTEIIPLLREYWFDNQAKADEAERRLLA